MLVKGLPADSLVRTPAGERGREPWTAYHELLAQLVEVTSVTAADHRLKKPMKVTRPGRPGDGQAEVAGQVHRARDMAAPNPYAGAIAALGGAQPRRDQPDQEQEPTGGMVPPPPRGDYGGAIAMLTGSQPRRNSGGSPA